MRFVRHGKNLNTLRRDQLISNDPAPRSQNVVGIAMEMSETLSYILVKPTSTVELVWNTGELKVPVLCSSLALTATCYN
jgi:hypothetical protein